MKIIFFGSPVSALPSLKKTLEQGHTIKLIITQPDKPSGRGKKLTSCPVKKFALELNIPIYQPEKIRKDPEALPRIKQIKPDLNVVVAYGQIIPSSIIYLPKYNSINLHFSFLPKYRGASPVQWSLLNGENKTGVTIFELNEKMDEGGILTQQEVDILPQETAPQLESRLSEIGADLLLRTIAQIHRTKPVKQDHAQATYAPLIKKEDGIINWEKNALCIERQIRAFTPWPSAFTRHFGRRIKILKGKKDKVESSVSSPGQVLAIQKEGLQVACGNGTVYLIESLQPENKKVMSAYAFSLGAKIKPGDKLG